MTDARLKQLRIKTGVVKRLTKDKELYDRELIVHKAKLEKYKVDGTDEEGVRHQEALFREAQMMVPDTQRRLLVACNELQQLVEQLREFKNSDDYSEAKRALAGAKPHLPKPGEPVHMC